MEFSLLVARILSVYFVISGLFLVVKRKTLPTLLKDFFAHPAIVYLTGVILIFFGLVLVFRTSIWDGMTGTITAAFGVLAFLKGAVYIFAPKQLASFHLERSRVFVIGTGIAMILLGGWLFSVL